MVRAVLAPLSCILFGLLCGGMLLVALALLPYWSALPPGEFWTWFDANGRRIGNLMFPLGGATVLAAVSALIANRHEPPRRRRWLGLAAFGAIVVGAVSAFILVPIDRELWTGVPPPDATTAALLGRWRQWHYVRLAFGLVGFLASVQALAAERA